MSANRTTASEPGDSVEQPSQAALCVNNCGFFSNPGCMGMCSMCFRKHAPKQEKKDSDKTASPAGTAPVGTIVQKDELMAADRSPVAQDVSRCTSAVRPSGDVALVPAAKDSQAGQPSIGGLSAIPDQSRPSGASSGGSTPRKKRCSVPDCRKRVGMMGFGCRCGGLFCEAHRYPESHCCEFDHKASERQKIAVDNPVIRGSKLDKI